MLGKTIELYYRAAGAVILGLNGKLGFVGAFIFKILIVMVGFITTTHLQQISI